MSDHPETPITPKDEPTAEELAAASVMRPIEELPSNFSVKGSPQMLKELPALTAFSEDDRQAIRQAAGSNDADAIQGAILSFLKDRSTAFKIMAGPGEGATLVEREALEKANNQRLYAEEVARLQAELDQVVDSRIERDEHGQPLRDENGNVIASPIFALQGSARAARVARMAEIRNQMSLLAGIEGAADMQRAARAEALKQRKLKAEIDEHRAINVRAHEIARDKRIEEAASIKAKFR